MVDSMVDWSGESTEVAAIRDSVEGATIDDLRDRRWRCRSSSCAARENSYHQKCLKPRKAWSSSRARWPRAGACAKTATAGVREVTRPVEAVTRTGILERDVALTEKKHQRQHQPFHHKRDQQQRRENGTIVVPAVRDAAVAPMTETRVSSLSAAGASVFEARAFAVTASSLTNNGSTTATRLPPKTRQVLVVPPNTQKTTSMANGISGNTPPSSPRLQNALEMVPRGSGPLRERHSPANGKIVSATMIGACGSEGCACSRSSPPADHGGTVPASLERDFDMARGRGKRTAVGRPGARSREMEAVEEQSAGLAAGCLGRVEGCATMMPHESGTSERASCDGADGGRWRTELLCPHCEEVVATEEQMAEASRG